MSYDAEEISVQSGVPIELYTFSHGVSTWRYTSSEADYTDTSVSPNVTYTSAPLERGAIEAAHEDVRNTLKITAPRSLAVADLFRVAPPSDVISITVRRVHRGDTASVAVIWVGRVLTAVFEGAKSTLLCEPITVALNRNGLRRLYGLTCPHVLYGTACGVLKTDFDAVHTVRIVSGVVLTVDLLPSYANTAAKRLSAINIGCPWRGNAVFPNSGSASGIRAAMLLLYSAITGVTPSAPTVVYAGGFVEWVNGDGNTERRFIESAETAGSPQRLALTLMQAFADIAVLDSVTVYPGCDHTLSICDSQFSNSANYGGWPFIPDKNPFVAPVF